MYWETTEDNAQLDLMTTVCLSLMKNGKGTVPNKRVLLMTDGQNQSLLDAMTKLGSRYDFDVTTYRKGDSYRPGDRKSTRLNSSHANISYAVFCLKKKKQMHLFLRH